MMKIKNIIGYLILFLFVISTPIYTTFAKGVQTTSQANTTSQDSGGLEPIDITNYHRKNNPTVNLTDFGDFTPVETVGEFSTKVLTFFMSILGGVAMLGVIAGGIMIMGGGFSENTMENGKTLLFYSVIGVGIAMLSMLIVTLSQSFLYSFGK